VGVTGIYPREAIPFPFPLFPLSSFFFPLASPIPSSELLPLPPAALPCHDEALCEDGSLSEGVFASPCLVPFYTALCTLHYRSALTPK